MIQESPNWAEIHGLWLILTYSGLFQHLLSRKPDGENFNLFLRLHVDLSEMQARLSNRIPELDGVRGIAILLVVAYHAFMFSLRPPHGLIAQLASYGFSGVDLFFVLSGFLITGILLDSKRQPAYFRNFYAKRALRIWPLYYLLLLLSFGLGPALARYAHLMATDLPFLETQSRLVYILLIQNLWYPLSSIPIILQMTWSLAIEEQFYFVWPWLVLLFNRKTLGYILAAVLFLSPLLRVCAQLSGVRDDVIITFTCFRLDGLALGGIIALWCKSDFWSLKLTKVFALIALMIGVPISCLLLKIDTLSSLRYSAISLASAGLVTFALWCSHAYSPFGYLFRLSWLRYVGQVSYCLYLVHQPIYYALNGRLARTFAGSGTSAAIIVMVLGFVASLTVATASWYLLESQVLKLRSSLEYHRQTMPTVTSKY